MSAPLVRPPVTPHSVFKIAERALHELKLSDSLFVQAVGFDRPRWFAVVADRDTHHTYKARITWVNDDTALNVEHFKEQMRLVLPDDDGAARVSVASPKAAKKR